MMKCKKHPEDDSSSSGVCGSCLRQRLVALIAAQAAQGDHFKEDERESEPNLNFPQSVSPYIFRRKSETAPVTAEFRRHDVMNNYNCLPDRKFFSTPQIGPAGKISVDDSFPNKRKGRRKFWSFSRLFRSKSEVTASDLDPRPSESTETTSRSWFSRRSHHHKSHQRHGRGMSPAMCSDDESEANYSTTEELKETPRRTPGRHGGGRRRNLSRNVSDIVFCLSPLVRPSPNRIWNQKGGGLPPEIGEARVPAKPPNLSKNRSRKLADFGRCKRNH